MEPAKLAARFQRLSASQQSIESLSAWCTENIAHAKSVVAVWNKEYAGAPAERQLALLYLANDVLQNGRKRGRSYVDEFFRVLPGAVRHLGRHGGEKMRRSVARLVDIWEDRKVFGSSGMRAIREAALDGGPGGRPREGGGGEEAAAKKLKLVEGLADTMARVQAAAKRCGEAQKALPMATLRQDVIENGTEEDLQVARRLLTDYSNALSTEVQTRTKAIQILRKELTDQEDSLQRSKEQLRLCDLQQKQVQEGLRKLASAVLQPEPAQPHYSPQGFWGDENPVVPQPPVPPQPDLPPQPAVPPQPPVPPRPPVQAHQEMSARGEAVFHATQGALPPPSAPANDQSRPPFQEGPSRPPFREGPSRPPFREGPSRPPFREGSSRPPFREGPSRPPFREAAPQPPYRNAQPPLPNSVGMHLHSYGSAEEPPQSMPGPGGMALPDQDLPDMDLSADPAPPPPPLTLAHQRTNGAHDDSDDVAAKLAASSEPAALLAQALQALPEEEREQFGMGMVDLLKEPTRYDSAATYSPRWQ